MTGTRRKEGFSGRTGLVLAALGMAIGTGNIWRFPRIAAGFGGGEDHGAGAFLLAWLLFLLLWSIPILIAEFTLGKVSRRGPIGAFSATLGRGAAWMGGFIVFTTLMIASYYSVVTGWTLKYLIDAVVGFDDLVAVTDAAALEANNEAAAARFNSLVESPLALAFHVAAAVLGMLIVWRGVRSGVELACKVLIPLLFVLLVGGIVWVFSQGFPTQGLNYLFDVNWQQFEEPELWVAALSQSAWSTGAGWGLILTYGAYARRREDSVTTNATAGFGNNIASLLAALFIFPAVFTLLGSAGFGYREIDEALTYNTPAGTGLAFQYVPFIFKSVAQWGPVLTVLFFAGLFIAALSSLIAMYEMGCRTFQDLGASRRAAVLTTGAIVCGVGVPAALDMRFFISMDWVWGVGLIVGGLMIAWAVQLYGVDRYRRRLINATGARVRLGGWFNWVFLFLIPFLGIYLLIWYLREPTDAAEESGVGHWDPFALGSYNAGTCVWWWAGALLLLMILTPWLGRRSVRRRDDDADGAEAAAEETTT